MHILLANVLDLTPDDVSVEMDEVSYDEVEHVDGDFATVWTPYRFYEDGKVSSRSRFRKQREISVDGLIIVACTAWECGVSYNQKI